VFDIRVVVRRGVQYLLARQALQALAALPVVVLISIVVSNRDQTISELVGRTSGYLYWSVAAMIVLRFRRPMRLWLDRKFFREEYDREQLLVGLLDDLSKVESVAEMSRLVSVQLESALHPKAVHLWHRVPGKLTLAYSSQSPAPPPPFPGSGWLLSWLETHAAPAAFPLPAGARISRAEARRFAEFGADLIVPITDSANGLVAILLLGEKKSRSPTAPAIVGSCRRSPGR
jgi:hypothetical protein